MQIFVQGRVFDKPIFRDTRAGKPLTKILVEIDDDRDKQANILPVTLFGRVAQQAADLQRGDRVAIGCRLSGTKFTTTEGETKYGCQLVGESIFLPAQGGGA
jgi:single-stranded DNA-binding protein